MMELPDGPIDRATASLLFQLLLLDNGAQIADAIPDHIDTDSVLRGPSAERVSVLDSRFAFPGQLDEYEAEFHGEA